MAEIPTTMLAASYEPGHINTVLKHKYPIRELKGDEILLKVAACGVCHSDVFLLSGGLPEPKPFILGHEIAGTPVLLGSAVDADKVKLGKLYSVLNPSCGTMGINGGPAFENALGLGLDGGYAEYVICKEPSLVPVPHGVPVEAAAVAADAGVTAYNAVKNSAGVKKRTKVLIFGIGGLGHLAVQYAKHLGATVYVCDFKPEARALALQLGAQKAFDLLELTDLTAAGKFTVDTTIDFVATAQSFNLAIAALSGNDVVFPDAPRLVMVGVSTENLVFSTVQSILTGIQIVSSAYGPRSALEEVLKLFAEGKVHPHIKTLPLKDVTNALIQLRAHEVLGRLVVVPE
ncbi:alcohol dehydrogenase [Mycena kentingensis (nom. inval.)]|nr:alcohol dehydrogenase [Mycena kentingensis (nom. inval.)]